MAVKYHCPKCEKRYVEWGAEKLGFKCPECDGEALLLVGQADAKPAPKKPKLKRKSKSKSKAKSKAKAKAKAKAKVEDEAKASLGMEVPEETFVNGQDLDAGISDLDDGDPVDVVGGDSEVDAAENAAIAAENADKG